MKSSLSKYNLEIWQVPKKSKGLLFSVTLPALGELGEGRWEWLYEKCQRYRLHCFSWTNAFQFYSVLFINFKRFEVFENHNLEVFVFYFLCETVNSQVSSLQLLKVPHYFGNLLQKYSWHKPEICLKICFLISFPRDINSLIIHLLSKFQWMTLEACSHWVFWIAIFSFCDSSSSATYVKIMSFCDKHCHCF